MQKYAYNIKNPTSVCCYDPENPLPGRMPLSAEENAAYAEYITALTVARKAGVPPIQYPKPPLFGQPAAQPESVPSIPAKAESPQVEKAAPVEEVVSDIDADLMKELIDGADSI